MLFIDTSAFVAIANERDAYHKKATDFLREVKVGRTGVKRLVTTDYVIDETLTNIRLKIGHRQAVEWGRAVLNSHVLEMIPIDREHLEGAFELFERYHDRRLSFTDCTSFEVMDALGIKKAFAFDDHFRVQGFEVVP